MNVIRPITSPVSAENVATAVLTWARTTPATAARASRRAIDPVTYTGEQSEEGHRDTETQPQT